MPVESVGCPLLRFMLGTHVLPLVLVQGDENSAVALPIGGGCCIQFWNAFSEKEMLVLSRWKVGGRWAS